MDKETERSSFHWTRESQRRMMLLLFMGAVLVYAARTASALCMPAMSAELGWDKQQQGLVMSCFLWGYPVTQILGGSLADRFGGATVIMAAACLWGSATFLTPLYLAIPADHGNNVLVWVMFCRIIQGLAQGAHFPAVMSMIAKKVPEKERTSVYSFIGAGTHGGSLLVGLLGSIIVQAFRWPYVFYLIGFSAILWIAVLGVSERKEDTVVHSPSDNLSPKIAASQRPSFPWSAVLLASPFWSMLFAHFCHGYSYSVFLFWLPTFFHDDYPQAQPWVYNVLPWIIDMLCAIASGKVADVMMSHGYSKTFIRKTLNVPAQLLFGLCLICLLSANSYSTVLFLICLAGAGHGFYQSTIIMMPNDIAPKNSGFMFGIMNTSGAIPGFMGTYISGYLLHYTADWGLMWAITGSISVLGWAVFCYYGSCEVIG